MAGRAKQDPKEERQYVILVPGQTPIIWNACGAGTALKEWAEDMETDHGTEVRIVEVSEMMGFTVERDVSFVPLLKEPR